MRNLKTLLKAMAKKMGVTMEVGNDGVAVITISNPPVNSLASPIISGLKEKFQDANHRSDVKAIVLTGLYSDHALDCILIISENGGRFSGGFNINVFQQVHKTGTQAALLVLTKTTQFISSSPCFGLVPSLPAVAKTKQHSLVLSLSKQMEFNGIAFDLYTLNITMNCFCRLRKLGLAFSVLSKILKLGFTPSTIMFSTLSLEGRVSEAVALVDRMVETKVRPDLITFTTLVNGLCLKGYVSEAMSLIDRMVEHGFRPDGVTYGTVLNRLCKYGETSMALDLLRKIKHQEAACCCS
ncbi:LOW QUALITY PROTEIN: hypothetical protein HID58_029697 [Brassica napus]|uniref:Uncharacterized protein n=1 Tax=Brassica napus TaxID=3708 RepID=A0ABQ8CDU4_BRANA|nr:LOW QUALITY PROTEIN: hypothetical protein HID58_029697 [Brassica napus]